MKPLRRDIDFKGTRTLDIIDYSLPQIECLLHWHQATELVVILKGEGQRSIGSDVRNFKAGDVMLIGSRVSHSYWGSEQNFSTPKEDWHRALVIHFDEYLDACQFQDSPLTLSLFKRIEHGGVCFGKKSAAKIQKLVESVTELPIMAKMAIIYQVIEIMSQAVVSEDDTEILASTNNKIEAINNERLRLVITFINKHHMETLTLSDVASKVGMRPDTFSRWFRKQAGETFRNYLISIRLQQIAHTLKTQKMTIMETAFQHGFSNLANFNRLFLQHYGVSPKVYRNQVQQRTSAISLTEKEPSQPIQLSTTSKLTISKEMQEALDASTEVDP